MKEPTIADLLRRGRDLSAAADRTPEDRRAQMHLVSCRDAPVDDERDDGTARALAVIRAARASPQFRQVDPHPHLSLVRRNDG